MEEFFAIQAATPGEPGMAEKRELLRLNNKNTNLFRNDCRIIIQSDQEVKWICQFYLSCGTKIWDSRPGFNCILSNTG